jgi:hypothetical protein
MKQKPLSNPGLAGAYPYYSIIIARILRHTRNRTNPGDWHDNNTYGPLAHSSVAKLVNIFKNANQVDGLMDDFREGSGLIGRFLLSLHS